ncbi:MAG: phosphoglycerate dehydrogenase-like enzyme [Gammaproteobacteria bacterium]|jgi:phosphoglycerate dehydrogenase-like enzyme
MSDVEFPAKDQLTVQFAHVAYQFEERFTARNSGIKHFQTWTYEDTLARADEADVLVLTGFWSPQVLEKAQRLKFIQVCGAGYNQFDLEAIKARNVRLCNGSGVNRNAVSDHAMALMLAMSRRLGEGRDNQNNLHWRGMISDRGNREDELAGKTLLIFGMGGIGERLARLAKAFEMRVIGFKRDPSKHGAIADEVHASKDFHSYLEQADMVALTCPLTDETANIIDAKALASMRESAHLINVARGGCVDTEALIACLQNKGIAGAALDVTEPEPLPTDSPLWAMDNVFITPHTAGETQRYEDNVIDMLLANLERVWGGNKDLINHVV